MAAVLILLARGTREGQYVHLGEFIAGHKKLHPRARAAVRGGDFAKFVYWGFIENRPTEPGSKQPESGYWRITDEGRRFASGQIRAAAKAAFTYNERLYGFSEETTSIREAVGDKFSYEELIAG